jgi:hypothetical protein
MLNLRQPKLNSHSLLGNLHCFLHSNLPPLKWIHLRTASPFPSSLVTTLISILFPSIRTCPNINRTWSCRINETYAINPEVGAKIRLTRILVARTPHEGIPDDVTSRRAALRIVCFLIVPAGVLPGIALVTFGIILVRTHGRLRFWEPAFSPQTPVLTRTKSDSRERLERTTTKMVFFFV